MRVVPGERGVCVGQCVTDVLLLQDRLCACGRHVDVQDLRSRDVEQPDGAHGVLELLGGAVFGELRGDRKRDVCFLSARTVVAGGQPELQPVPCELAGCCGERVEDELHLRRWLYGGRREHVRVLCGWHVQSGDGVGLVQRLSGARIDVGGGEGLVGLLVRDGVHQNFRRV